MYKIIMFTLYCSIVIVALYSLFQDLSKIQILITFTDTRRLPRESYSASARGVTSSRSGMMS